MQPPKPDAEVQALSALAASVELALRAGLRDGAASVAIIDNWDGVDAWMDDHAGALAEIISSAAEIDPSIATAVATGAQSIGVAVVGAQGRLYAADARFADWIGEPAASIGCMRLVRKALDGRRVLGVVETDRHGVLSVFAAAGEEAAKWGRLAGSGEPARHGTVALVVFAPSRSSDLVAGVAEAYGLSPLETRLLGALIGARSLEAAAREIGVGRETAKDALTGACRKAGVSGAAELIGRVMELNCRPVAGMAGETALGDVLGLSPSETRVAAALGQGLSAKAAAESLGLSEQTVASYRRTIFTRTGVNRARDLGRLLAEVAGLERLTGASEVVLDPKGDRERLRIVTDGHGRRIAFIDYGPASGRPLVIGHGSASGRIAPPSLLARLHASGRRVIVPQRPGYGLTSPAPGDPFGTAADDLSLILDRLDCGAVEIVSRGPHSAFEFAARHPDRLKRLVLINTLGLSTSGRRGGNPLSVISRMLIDHPGLVEPFGRMLVRQSRSDLVASIVHRIGSEVEADRLCMSDPVTLAHVIRDAQGLLGPSIAGFVAEHSRIARDWRPPASLSGRRLVLLRGGGLRDQPSPSAWPTLAEARAVSVPDGGWFVHYTHPDAIVACLNAPD